MKKLNQSGLTGPIEIGLIVLALAIVGFAAYRIGSAQTDDTSANSGTGQSDDEASEIVAKEAEEDTAKEVEVPKEEETKEVVEEPKEEVKKETEPAQEDKKKEITYVDLTISTAAQDGEYVYGAASLKTAYTGTCYMKLYKEGQEKIIQETKLTNGATDCSAKFPVSEVPVAGEWQMHAWFNSAGGTVEAYAPEKTLTVTL